MEQLTLTTPALLFSAISLVMLAYTNRFLAYSAVIRNLHDKYLKEKDKRYIKQISNIKKRLHLTRNMMKSKSPILTLRLGFLIKKIKDYFFFKYDLLPLEFI